MGGRGAELLHVCAVEAHCARAHTHTHTHSQVCTVLGADGLIYQEVSVVCMMWEGGC